MVEPLAPTRPATPADGVAIETLLRAQHLPTQGAREHLAAYRVVEADARVVACAGLELHGGTDALLRSVAVADSHQGRALGQALVRALLADARQHGVDTVHLLTTTAPAYFERLGFVRCPRDSAPAALQASEEFRGACPASAILMRRATGDA